MPKKARSRKKRKNKCKLGCTSLVIDEMRTYMEQASFERDPSFSDSKFTTPSPLTSSPLVQNNNSIVLTPVNQSRVLSFNKSQSDYHDIFCGNSCSSISLHGSPFKPQIINSRNFNWNSEKEYLTSTGTQTQSLRNDCRTSTDFIDTHFKIIKKTHFKPRVQRFRCLKKVNKSYHSPLYRHRGSFKDSPLRPVNSTINVIKQLWEEIKKYARAPLEIVASIKKVFSNLGIIIKKGLESLGCIYVKAESRILELNTENCNCNGHDREINELKEKVSALQVELASLREEVKDLRQRLDGPCSKISNFVCVPPPPPPPPPPPLPLNPLFDLTNKKLSIVHKNIDKKEVDDSKRPVISLDEILNVKLRKTSERPVPVRRATVAYIPQNIFAEVKLRSSRPSTPVLQELVSSPSGVNDCLIKILTTNSDSNVRRVKRLKRVDGYSFDDISRKSGVMRHERERVYY